MTYIPTTPELRLWLSQTNADAIAEAAQSIHPHDLATYLLELQDGEIWDFLKLAPMPEGAEVFSHVPLERQILLIEYADTKEAAKLLTYVHSDLRTDLIQMLDDRIRTSILSRMPHSERAMTERLATYAEHTVGAVMSGDFAQLPMDVTATQALEALRAQAQRKETIYYAYVVNEEGQLKGFVSLKDLMLADEHAIVETLMHTEVISVQARDNHEEAAQLIQEYDLLALPVIEGDNRLVGIVTVDDVIDLVDQETTTDFHKMAPIALAGLSIREAGIWTLFRIRVPWLLVLVFMNIFSGAGIAYFEDTIEAMVALVFFLPLLIDSGGNAGAQSATLMIRSLATGDVQLRDWIRLIGREVLVALAIGVAMGIAVSGIAVYRADAGIAVVVSMTMVCTVLVGSLIGMSLPFLLGKFKFDPATASAPLVTSLADIAGVLIYFSIATWWLSDRISEFQTLASL